MRPSGQAQASWNPSNVTELQLSVARIGLWKSEARIYLLANGEETPRYVVRLIGVFKLFDSLPRHRPIQITDVFPHGCFGWDLPKDNAHRSIEIRVSGGKGFLLALSKDVEYRAAS